MNICEAQLWGGPTIHQTKIPKTIRSFKDEDERTTNR